MAFLLMVALEQDFIIIDQEVIVQEAQTKPVKVAVLFKYIIDVSNKIFVIGTEWHCLVERWQKTSSLHF
jgi:hypothetical protein